ncbi:MAG: hypothetical protein ABJE95_10055 [Byssovorax sp.]
MASPSSLRLAVALLAVSSLPACASDPPLPTPSAPSIEVRFLLDEATLPRFLDVPFPSDLYLDADGTIVDTIPGLDAVIPQNAASVEAALASQRGFSINAGAVFRVDEPPDRGGSATVDPASLPASEAASIADDSAAFLIDLDAASPEAARVPCRVSFHDDRQAGSDTPPVLAVLPARGVVLAEGHRHAVVLTTRLTADGGQPVGASAALQKILAAGPGAGASTKLYADAAKRVGDLVAPLADRSKIAGLTVFTTESASHELVAMRELTAALPPPALRWDPATIAPMHAALFATTPLAGYTATLDDWLGAPAKLADGTDDPASDQPGGAAHHALAAIGTAVFDAPNFLRVRSGGYADPEHATVARDALGQPEIDPARPTAKVWITIALPQGKMPAAGFPVVLLQHGLGGDRSFLLALADTFAKQGWASVAIEATTFGARAALASSTIDAASTFAWSKSAAYAGPDGFVDAPATATALFGEFLSFGATRDQLRQSVVDLGTLGAIVAGPALDLGPLLQAVPGARFDPSRIGYVGDSFGGILGAMVAAVDPTIRNFVLNVGGGGIVTEILSNAPALATLVSTAGGLNFGVPRDQLDGTHPLGGLLQSILDPADPLTHARAIVKSPAVFAGKPNPPKSVILIEAFWDEIVANEGSEALARAAGMKLASPSLGPRTGVPLDAVAPVDGAIHDTPVSGATAVLVQASPASHGADLYEAHGKRHYAIPFGQPAPTPFPILANDVPIREPYLGLQAMAVSFFSSAFAGAVPQVKNIPPPRRDFDDDGTDDATDPDPLDPTKK